MTPGAPAAPGASAPVPLDQTVLDVLRQSPVGPMLDKPVNTVLADLGLPQLPNFVSGPPLPGLPPLPPIDLSLLFKPFTDMLASFGNGQLQQAAGGIDPSQVISGIGKVVDTVIQLASTAMQAMEQGWQGQGSEAAQTKGAQAQKDGAAVSAQSAQTSAILQAAAASVARGLALLEAIFAKYVATVTAMAPLLGTPGGQSFIVAYTAETLAEAAAVVAQTRAELTVHTANMTAAGQKVPITTPPNPGTAGAAAAGSIAKSAGEPLKMAMQLLQTVKPLVELATSNSEKITDAARSAGLLPAKPGDPATPGGVPGAVPAVAGAGGAGGAGSHKAGAVGGGGGGAGAMGGGVGVAPTPLTPWNGAKVAGTGAVASAGVATSASSVTAGGSATASTPGMMPYAPMAGAGMAGGAQQGEESSTHDANVVTAAYGDEVVGEIGGISPPVVGEAERRIAADVPDKELTL